MTISEWLKEASNRLADNVFSSPRLDAEIILAHTIGHPRTYLHAHPDEEIDVRHEEIVDARLDLRLDYVPIAYIIGHKEFFGRRFHVSPAVLIPRPESEEIIELLGEVLPKTTALEIGAQKRLVDIGTGSGCLGITASLEHPELEVTLLDESRGALNIAEKNIRALAAEGVQTMRSNLLDSYPYTPDIVLANLPYVDKDWERSEETKHEPAEALFADRGGLNLIEKCFDQLSIRMQPGGIAIFEADPRQWIKVIEIGKKAGFTPVNQKRFAYSLVKH